MPNVVNVGRLGIAREAVGMLAFSMLALLACRDATDLGPVSSAPVDTLPAVRDVRWSLMHTPGNPTVGAPVTLTVSASQPRAVNSIQISVDGNLAATCNGGSCTYSAELAEGVHDYSVTADVQGLQVSVGSSTFTVWVPHPRVQSSYSSVSPHWRHIRTSTIDYRIHYQKGAQQIEEYDWAAGHFDHVTGGNLDQFKSRNPKIRHFPYDTYWFVPVRSAEPAETWLAANGYNVEDAYLHLAGTAKLREHRVTAQQYAGRDYWYYDVGDPGFQAWRQFRTHQLMQVNDQGHRSDGIFFDTNARQTVRKYVPGRTLEFDSYTSYFAAFDALLASHRAWVPSGYVILNQSAYFNKAEEQSLAQIAGGMMLEFVNGPYRNPHWEAVDNALRNGITVEYGTAIKANHKDETRYDVTPGNYATIAERVLMWEYASYLMVVDPMQMDLLYFEPYLGSWDSPMSNVWLEAFEHDLGPAGGPRTVLAKGKDPAGQTFEVYQREFENALVLIRRHGSKGSSDTYHFGENSAVRVTPSQGPWRMLLADGRLIGPVTSVQLRCGEAVILVR